MLLRLRFLKNGRDFASAFVRNVQAGPRVLSTINMLTNQGECIHLTGQQTVSSPRAISASATS